MGEILLKTEGNSNAELLENKIYELSDELSKEGVTVIKGVSLVFGAEGIIGTLIISIIGGVAGGVILKIIDKLFEKTKDITNVNIKMRFVDSDITFFLPEDKQKLLDYCTKMNKNKQ